MKTRLAQTYLLLLLILTVAGCGKTSKNKDDTSNSSSDTSKTAVATSDTCAALFDSAAQMSGAHLEKYNIDPKEYLRMALKEEVAELSKYSKMPATSFDESKVTPGDCSEITNFLSVLAKNETFIQNFKDVQNFDALSFFLEMVLSRFANHLDPHSDFIGVEAMLVGDQFGVVDTGFRFLKRSDYSDKKSENGKVAGRNPPYLYVQQSPTYLRSMIPPSSHIFQVNDIVVKDHNYFESTAQFMKVGPATITYMPYDKTTGKLGEMVTQEFELQQQTRGSTGFQIINTKPGPVIGYLQISSFLDKELKEELKDTWMDYLSSSSDKLDGTIIDLRSNGGGRVDSMAKILGTIVKAPGAVLSNQIFRKNGEWKTAPQIITPTSSSIKYGKIVVLTDFRTASASEMFVAALQDYHAALIVGEPTFGKGIGQTLISLKKPHIIGTAIVTNFYLTSPAGRSWYLKRLQPDILADDKFNDGYLSVMSDESNLPPAFSINADSNFDKSISTENPLTTSALAQLKTFRADPANEPSECTSSPSDLMEEDSCILKWGIRLLKEWIRIEPNQS